MTASAPFSSMTKVKGPIVHYFPGGGGGFGGGYNFKSSPFLRGKFFTGKKHKGGQIL